MRYGEVEQIGGWIRNMEGRGGMRLFICILTHTEGKRERERVRGTGGPRVMQHLHSLHVCVCVCVCTVFTSVTVHNYYIYKTSFTACCNVRCLFPQTPASGFVMEVSGEEFLFNCA